MSVAPPLSVLFPVRNAAGTVGEALASLSAQTFPSFEILVVDDGSTDATPEILRDVARDDPRIHIRVQEPRGIVPALERARAQARGPYLARMDADDLAEPTRFQKQMDFLASDGRMVACGTGVTYFPAGELKDGSRRYQEWINGLAGHGAMERDLFVECPIPHPTLILRARAMELVGGYRDRGWPEDYDLVLRLWEGGGRLGKVPEPLLRWRLGEGRLSVTSPTYSLEAFRRCKVHFLRRAHLSWGREVVIWGAGPVGKAFARELLRQGGRLRAFVDLDPRKIGQEIHGVTVLHPDEGKKLGDVFTLAAVARPGAREEIRRVLTEAGRVELEDFVAVA